MSKKDGQRIDPKRVSDLVREAGGKVVGKTRLQKIAYFLEVAGLGDGFEFSYRHFGPYSEELATAVQSAKRLSLLSEEEHATSWGGIFSIYSSEGKPSRASNRARKEFLEMTLNCNAVALELAATALFLYYEKSTSPWDDTARRKPEKAAGKLEEARQLYSKIRLINAPERFPELN